MTIHCNVLRLRNLTPHPVTLCGRTLQSEGIARLVVMSEHTGDIDFEGFDGSVPVYSETLGGIDGLPLEASGTLLIVSRLVFDRAKAQGRIDVVALTEFERDAEGRIVGAGALVG